MNRPFIIGILCGEIAIAAIGLSFLIERKPDRRQVVTVTIGRMAASAATPAAPRTVTSSAMAPMATPPAARRPKPTARRPMAPPPAGKPVVDRAALGKKPSSAGHAPGPGAKSGDAPATLPEIKRIEAPERSKDNAGGGAEKPSAAPALSAPRGAAVVGRPDGKLQEIARALRGRETAEPPGSAVTAAPAPRLQKAAASAAVEGPRPSGPVRVGVRAPGGETGLPALTLEIVEYDERGNVAISGRAAGGSTVQVYLNNRPVGGATTGEAGVWRLAPNVTVPPGLYRMRIDQTNGSGKVVARIETPFARASPLGELPRDAVVFVQPGNSLWRIARRTYGHGIRYKVIYKANRDQIRNPDLIYPGQIFSMPQIR